jgi:hypothetical protein
MLMNAQRLLIQVQGRFDVEVPQFAKDKGI